MKTTTDPSQLRLKNNNNKKKPPKQQRLSNCKLDSAWPKQEFQTPEKSVA